MPKLQQIRRKNETFIYSVNIPLSIVESLKLKKGDNLLFGIIEGKILISKENMEIRQDG